MLIINDVHIGFDRQAGATPASREALRTYLFEQFGAVFKTEAMNPAETHIVINGDLFDKFEIDTRDWLQTFMILSAWLQASHVQLGSRLLRKLTLVAGNHDHSAKALRVSSFELLCKVLKEQFGDAVQVVGIDEWAFIDGDEASVVALAHCSNQDIFDMKLKELMAMAPSITHLLLHCNFDNKFAAVSDHSLNVTRDVAREFTDHDVTLCFAHEHQAKRDFKGKVTIFGNQWPTSVSDCLTNTSKSMHTLENGVLTSIGTWSMEDPEGFAEIDWRELPVEPHLCGGFIRVTGTATMNEAGDCITALAKFRAKCPAFVVTNAVKIEGIADNEALPESFEAAKAFDVMEFINSNLDESQQAAVRKLSEVQR